MGLKLNSFVLYTVIAFAIICTTLLITNFYPILLEFLHPELSDLNSMAKFGDSFGSLNAVFSGFAFLMIFVTMNAQRKSAIREKALLDQTKLVNGIEAIRLVIQDYELKMSSAKSEHERLLFQKTLDFYQRKLKELLKEIIGPT